MVHSLVIIAPLVAMPVFYQLSTAPIVLRIIELLPMISEEVKFATVSKDIIKMKIINAYKITVMLLPIAKLALRYKELLNVSNASIPPIEF